MKTEQTINELEINGVQYVRKDSVKSIEQSENLDGMPFVLIRSDRSGVHFGYLKSKEVALDKWNVTLVKSRRVFYWSGACSLSQLALDGSNNPSACKITVELPCIEIAGVIEIIPISKNGEANLKGVPVWKK